MASLERWKFAACLLVFCILRSNLAANLSVNTPTRTENVAHVFPKNCDRFEKKESLEALNIAADKSCTPEDGQRDLAPKFTAQSYFCERLRALTALVCKQNKTEDSVIIGSALNGKNPCSGIDSKGEPNPPVPWMDSKALVGGTEDVVDICKQLCAEHALILCNFMLVAAHVTVKSEIQAPNQTNLAGPSKVEISSGSAPSLPIDPSTKNEEIPKLATKGSDSTAGTGNSPLDDISSPVLESSNLPSGDDPLPLNRTTQSAVVSSHISQVPVAARKNMTDFVVNSTATTDRKLTFGIENLTTIGNGILTVAEKHKTSEVKPTLNVATSSSHTTTNSTIMRVSPPIKMSTPGVQRGPGQTDGSNDFSEDVMQAHPNLDEEDNNDNSNPPLLQGEEYDEDSQPLLPDKMGGSITSNNEQLDHLPPANTPKKHSTFSIAYPDGSGSGFLPVFFLFVILSISLYFVYHYRNKIMGLLLEGRSERRRRPNTSQYRRLSSKLEDVLPVDAETGSTGKRAANIIY